MSVGMLGKLLEDEEKEAEKVFVMAEYIGETAGNLVRILTKSDYPYMFDVCKKLLDKASVSESDACAARTNALNMLARFRKKGDDHDGDNAV